MGLVNCLAGGSVGQRFRYAYDPNGNVARTTFAYEPFDEERGDLRHVVYAYDALNSEFRGQFTKPVSPKLGRAGP